MVAIVSLLKPSSLPGGCLSGNMWKLSLRDSCPRGQRPSSPKLLPYAARWTAKSGRKQSVKATQTLRMHQTGQTSFQLCSVFVLFACLGGTHPATHLHCTNSHTTGKEKLTKHEIQTLHLKWTVKWWRQRSWIQVSALVQSTETQFTGEDQSTSPPPANHPSEREKDLV